MPGRLTLWVFDAKQGEVFRCSRRGCQQNADREASARGNERAQAWKAGARRRNLLATEKGQDCVLCVRTDLSIALTDRKDTPPASEGIRTADGGTKRGVGQQIDTYERLRQI